MYVTVAVVELLITTLDTLAADVFEIDSPVASLIIWLNALPFWRREIFLAAEVVPEKNPVHDCFTADTSDVCDGFVVPHPANIVPIAAAVKIRDICLDPDRNTFMFRSLHSSGVVAT